MTMLEEQDIRCNIADLATSFTVGWYSSQTDWDMDSVHRTWLRPSKFTFLGPTPSRGDGLWKWRASCPQFPEGQEGYFDMKRFGHHPTMGLKWSVDDATGRVVYGDLVEPPEVNVEGDRLVIRYHMNFLVNMGYNYPLATYEVVKKCRIHSNSTGWIDRATIFGKIQKDDHGELVVSFDDSKLPRREWMEMGCVVVHPDHPEMEFWMEEGKFQYGSGLFVSSDGKKFMRK